MISSILCVLTQYVHIAVAYIWNTLSFSIIRLCSVRAIITIYAFFFIVVVAAAVIFFLFFSALCYATAADPSWAHIHREQIAQFMVSKKCVLERTKLTKEYKTKREPKKKREEHTNQTHIHTHTHSRSLHTHIQTNKQSQQCTRALSWVQRTLCFDVHRFYHKRIHTNSIVL